MRTTQGRRSQAQMQNNRPSPAWLRSALRAGGVKPKRLLALMTNGKGRGGGADFLRPGHIVLTQFVEGLEALDPVELPVQPLSMREFRSLYAAILEQAIAVQKSRAAELAAQREGAAWKKGAKGPRQGGSDAAAGGAGWQGSTRKALTPQEVSAALFTTPTPWQPTEPVAPELTVAGQVGGAAPRGGKVKGKASASRAGHTGRRPGGEPGSKPQRDAQPATPESNSMHDDAWVVTAHAAAVPTPSSTAAASFWMSRWSADDPQRLAWACGCVRGGARACCSSSFVLLLRPILPDSACSSGWGARAAPYPVLSIPPLSHALPRAPRAWVLIIPCPRSRPPPRSPDFYPQLHVFPPHTFVTPG